MAVDVAQGIPFKMDAFSDAQFVVPDDMTDPLNPIPKMICRMGPWDGTQVTSIPKKLLTTVDNCAQFKFELYGWSVGMGMYDATQFTFDVFLEAQGPKPEWGHSGPPGTTSLTENVTSFSSGGNDIATGIVPHREYS